MNDIATRALGKTGERVSTLCLGGGHVGIPSLSTKEAVRIVQYAVDSGITFLDNAWEYNEGLSESRMGEAISDRRDKVFLMTKVCARDRGGAERQLHESLRRLRTDYVDLWQFHEINYGNDHEWIFEPSGAAEAARAALQAGKVRYIGSTGHKDPEYLLRMLEYDFPWAAAQMPINILDSGFRSFTTSVLPELEARGIAAIGMKSLGGSAELVTRAGLPVGDCIRFALSQSIASLVCGMESIERVDQNLDIARNFEPMSAEEQQALTAKTAGVAGDGRYERYKTTQNYDSQVHRRQHCFPE